MRVTNNQKEVLRSDMKLDFAGQGHGRLIFQMPMVISEPGTIEINIEGVKGDPLRIQVSQLNIAQQAAPVARITKKKKAKAVKKKKKAKKKSKKKPSRKK